MSAKTHKLYFLLQTTAAALKRAADDALIDGAGVTAAQAAVLGLIDSNRPASQKRIAGQLRQNESAMTQMVTRLIAMGLVARNRADHDKRQWQLTLTPAGERAKAEARAAFAAVNAAMDAVMDGDTAACLATTLDAIFQKVETRTAGPD
ncbi:MarR family winged helix-turn-helix transcriptional regulator [Eilatimonas milleporae]|uniref:DNA-binding MarR family transcriptional regulator n=1 Tax=Eilatimonas milleporae TaxID=911205 RepID=A0A3M0CP54_9PROT|nr:MarR family transcriptional regulator [Eilatimonas milleporae]RMB08669.1 DNA-binding MarR family transcriptional regulator [Eilatimonas milleporae]